MEFDSVIVGVTTGINSSEKYNELQIAFAVKVSIFQEELLELLL